MINIDTTTGVWCVIYVTPIGKPRMVKSDSWKKRKCVQKYWKFKDTIQQYANSMKKVKNPSVISWVAYFPFPKSYTAKQRSELKGKPHQIKPDKDNIEKAIFDALLKNDQCIYAGTGIKLWDDGNGARIEILIK